MYSGFLKSNDTLDHNLFYWMYKTNETAAADTPVTIWLNGGPGSSSAFGNFLENGPLKISQTVNKTEGAADTYSFLIKNNPQGSWANKSTMIYVDQPIGTGYSYSLPAVYLENMTAVSDEFVQFMKNLFIQYPEFNGKRLYIAGESYAGKYLPAFSVALHKAGFNLQGTLIGDPLSFPVS